jgi:hypothetical protein
VNRTGITKTKAEMAVETVFETMKSALAEGQRIELGTYSSSPLLADGKLYCTNEEGITTVVQAGPQFAILSVNRLEGYTLASPVAVDGQVFIRTGEALYAIGKR